MTTDLIRFSSSFFNLEPFDVMFRDLFDSDSVFGPVMGSRNSSVVNINYPVDIKATEKGLEIDIAAVGLEKKDINLKIEDGDILRVEYAKQEKEEIENEGEYCIRQGITRRAFKFAWRIAPKFNLDKIEATMENGLLQLRIPVASEYKPKKIEIK